MVKNVNAKKLIMKKANIACNNHVEAKFVNNKSDKNNIIPDEQLKIINISI